MDENTTQRFRQKLLDLQRQLASDIEDQSIDGVELDPSRVGRLSRMDAMQAQAMAKATGERRQVKLRQIRSAIERLDQGEYGNCARCATAIDPRRLEIDPVATLCIGCASDPRP